MKDTSKTCRLAEAADLRALKASLTVEKQLTAVCLMSGCLKVLLETKLYSRQIKIAF